MSHGSSTSSRRMSGEERRSVIIDAALQEFSRAGYHGASTARIAAAAGCSEPMLYKHFAGKQDLFIAVLLETTQQLDAQYESLVANAPGDNLATQILNSMPMMFQAPLYAETMRMRMLAMSVIELPAVRATLEKLHTDLVEGARAAFDQSAAEGNVPEWLDPDYIVWMWTGVQFASCYRDALEPGGFAAMLPHAERFIESLIPPE